MCGPWPPLPIALYIGIFPDLTSPILPRGKSLIIICWLQIICVAYAGGACEAWEAVVIAVCTSIIMQLTSSCSQ